LLYLFSKEGWNVEDNNNDNKVENMVKPIPIIIQEDKNEDCLTKGIIHFHHLH
jgi:hypothetical protein